MAVTLRIFFRALKRAFVDQTWTLITNYIQVPLGIIVLLIPCWAVNIGLLKYSITFPPSIICMGVLFIILLFTHYLSPNRIFQSIYKSLKPACNWSLGTVGIFMTPSFITILTLSKDDRLSTNTDLSSRQIGFLIAFFLPPLIVTWVIDIMICKLIAKALPFSVDDIYNYEHLDHPVGSSQGSNSSKRPDRIITSSRPHPHLNQDARWVATPSPEFGDANSSRISLAVDTKSLVEVDQIREYQGSLQMGAHRHLESPLSRGRSDMPATTNSGQKDPQSSRTTIEQAQDLEWENVSDFNSGQNSNLVKASKIHKGATNLRDPRYQKLNLTNRRTHRKFNSDPIVEKRKKEVPHSRTRSISLTLSIISHRRQLLAENTTLLSSSHPPKGSGEISNTEQPQRGSTKLSEEGNFLKKTQLRTINAPEGNSPSSLNSQIFCGSQISVEKLEPTTESWNAQLERSSQTAPRDEKRPKTGNGKQRELLPFPTLDSQFQSPTLESGTPYRKTRRKRIPTDLIHYEASIIDVEVIPEPISRPGISVEFALSRRIARILDLIFYLILTGIGIALFYTPGGTERSQVLFIGVISLIWLFSRRIIPQSWTKILHPALTTSLLSSVAIMGIGASRGLSPRETFDRFYYDRTYLELFNPLKEGKVEVMGAGDILESVLDAGTVGLAFTVFDYRRDLYRNFFRVILVVLPNCCLSLTAWPFLARHLNVVPSQAIDFAGRSMSAPLALELLKAVDGNKNLGVVLVYLTGITVSFLRTPMFRLFKIRPASLEEHEDYFTIGATVGAVGGVIGTSSLLKRHRRAAGTATVALVLYAIIMLGLVAVHPIARFVSGLAGVDPTEAESE